MDIICFHNPEEENGYLSNWFYSKFSIDDIGYTSMEQYMMYKKAICFNDVAIAEQILSTNDVAQIKELGRLVSGYNDSIWSGIRQIVVYDGLIAKFAQNENLRSLLKSTEKAILAECAVKDCIWGIGLSMKDPRRMQPEQWKGHNLLGYTLMMVRERL
ncbi:MAG: NADAR family protein [Lachnospiraceae bacterium]|nr:NADAR family protein [Lachnospiraceae bacterium]